MNIKCDLKTKFKYNIELHAHTGPVSPCSEISPENLVDFHIKNGYDAVVITNHFRASTFEGRSVEEGVEYYLSDFYKAKAYAKDRLKVILGAEVCFNENRNDFLIYGVDRDLLKVLYNYLDKGVETFRREVKLKESVFIQAHPFREMCSPVEPEILDGIEVYNMHPGHNSKPSIAIEYAKRNNVNIQTVGSDFHHLKVGHTGMSRTRIKVLPNNSFELADILKKGEYLIQLGDDLLI